MSDAMRRAVEEAVARARSNGTVLLVHETARRIAVSQGGSGDDIDLEVARALIEEGARKGAVMQFSKSPPDASSFSRRVSGEYRPSA